MMCAAIACPAAAGSPADQRLVDAHMLADIDLDEVVQRVGQPRVVDRPADLLADEGDEGVDVAVAGRPRDLAVEGKVGLDAAFLPALLAAHAVERRLDCGKVLVAAPRRGERGGFGFQDAAQLEQVLHVLRRSSAPRGRCGSQLRCSGASTKAPTPWRASIMPSARNWAIASRTTLRLTPNFSASCCSVGSRAPGLKSPDSISRLSNSMRRDAARLRRRRSSASAAS